MFNLMRYRKEACVKNANNNFRNCLKMLHDRMDLTDNGEVNNWDWANLVCFEKDI